MFLVGVSLVASMFSVWIPIVLWAPFVGLWMYGKLERHVDEQVLDDDGQPVDIDTTQKGWVPASILWAWNSVKWTLVRFSIGIGLYSCLIWTIRDGVISAKRGLIKGSQTIMEQVPTIPSSFENLPFDTDEEVDGTGDKPIYTRVSL